MAKTIVRVNNHGKCFHGVSLKQPCPKCKATFRKFVGRLMAVAFVLTASSVAAQTPHVGALPATYVNMPAIPDGCPTTVPAGQTVTWAGAMTIDCVTIHGTVLLADGLRLTVTTIQVPDGTLTTASPVGHDIRITFTSSPIDPIADPEQYTHGLIASGGTVTLRGDPRLTVAVLASAVRAGDTSLTFAVPPMWAPGERLVVPGTDQPVLSDGAPYVEHDEVVTVASCAGVTCALVTPTVYAHPAAHDRAGTARFFPVVGSLTRSVTLVSADPAGIRGHVLVTGRSVIDLEYVALVDVGRTRWQTPLDSTTFGGDGTNNGVNPVTHLGTNQIGRYALHFHHLVGPVTPQANGKQFTVIGLAVERSSKWGITVHDSHYGLVQSNVLYQDGGAGLMTEDGSETGNVIDGNLAIGTTGYGQARADERSASGEFGFDGSGFWFRGPNNVVTNNLAFTSAGYAYSFVMLGVTGVKVPAAQGHDPMVDGVVTDMTRVPLRQFLHNTAAASLQGLTIWNLMASCCTDVWEGPESVVDHLIFWHIPRGYYGYGHNHLTFDYLTHINDPAILRNDYEGQYSLYFGDYITRNQRVTHADIENLKGGITVPYKAGDIRDIYGAVPGTITIEDSLIHATVGIYRAMQSAVTGGGAAIPGRLVTVRRTTFLTPTADLGSTVPYAINSLWRSDIAGTDNPTVTDRLVVEDFNNVAGDNFETFYTEQATQTIAGGLAPCVTTRAGIHGFACGQVVVVDKDQVCTVQQGTASGWLPNPSKPGWEYQTRVDTVVEVTPPQGHRHLCVPPVGTQTTVIVAERQIVVPPTFSAASAAKTCTYTLTASGPPTTATGWKGQFRQNGTSFGTVMTTAPWTRTKALDAGQMTGFTLTWTKTGQPTVVIPTFAVAQECR